MSMGEKKQAAALAAFREGKVNVLVATQIGSEGMDFRQVCLFVSPLCVFWGVVVLFFLVLDSLPCTNSHKTHKTTRNANKSNT